MSTNSSSLVVQHALGFRTVTSGDLLMNDFSSLKFSKLHLKSDIPGPSKLYSLQLNQASMQLFEAAENRIQLNNDNGGFIAFGWCKRGKITDKSIIAARNANGVNGENIMANGGNKNNQEGMYVDSGDISYRIVQVFPSNQDFFDPTTTLGIELEDLKYDVRDVNTE